MVLPDDRARQASGQEAVTTCASASTSTAGTPAIETSGTPKFDDPLAFLGAFTSATPGVSGTNWSNATYDALIKARATSGGT